jgi:hypothetical protein
VWAAAYAEDWEKTVALAYLANFSPETRTVLRKIQSVAISIRVEKPLEVQGALQCADEPAAKALLQFLLKQKPEELKDLKIYQKDSWVSIQGNVSDLAFVVNKMKIPNAGP